MRCIEQCGPAAARLTTWLREANILTSVPTSWARGTPARHHRANSARTCSRCVLVSSTRRPVLTCARCLLQEAGALHVGDIAQRTKLGVDLLRPVLQQRLGSVIQGRLEGGLLYTDAHITRIRVRSEARV